MNKQTEALILAIEQRLVIEQPNHVLDTYTGREMPFEFAEAYAHGFLKMIGKEALEQPAQEPVAWISVKDKLPPQEINFLSFSETFGYQVSMYSNNPVNSTGLPMLERLKITHWMTLPSKPNETNTHPASSFIGLSDDEIRMLEDIHKVQGTVCGVGVKTFARAIEQKLKEKNGQ